MRRLQVGASIVVGVGLLGCPTAPPVPSDATGASDDPSSESDTSTGASMTSMPTSSSSTPTGSGTSDPTSDTTSTGASSESSSSTTGPACVEGELGGACDPFGDDCPDCAKCMPYADDGGGTWNASACAPVVPIPDGVGDSCAVADSVASGLDTCDHGSICWGVDPTALEGTCVPLCSGMADDPICESPLDTCLRGDGVMAVCVAGCDPLLQNCVDDDGCYPSSEDGFGCVRTSPDAAAFGEPCDGFNACAAGLFCAEPGAVPGCAGSCCSEFCDVTDPEASANCPGAAGGQECVEWFAAGQAPPGYDDLGACILP